jgi:hypothetical protein
MSSKITARIAAGLLAAVLSAGSLQAMEMRLKPTEVKILNLAERPGTIVVSHPEFISVQMIGGKKMLIQGLATGYTNVLVLDRRGEKLANIDVSVSSRGDKRLLRVYAGGERSSYICNPECAPSMTSNDSPRAIADRIRSIQAYRGLASAASENNDAVERPR